MLSARHVALWGPTDAHERLAVADEIVAVANRVGDGELAVQGHAWRLVDLLELGRVAAADHAIADHARLARDLGQPLHIRDSALWAATRALLDGRFEDAEHEAQRALSLGQRAHDPHADMFWWAQRYWMVLENDASTRDIADLLDVSLELAERYRHVPAWHGKIALLHARLGDRDTAAAVSSQLSAERLAGLPRDAVWLGGLYYLAEVAAFLSDPRPSSATAHRPRPCTSYCAHSATASSSSTALSSFSDPSPECWASSPACSQTARRLSPTYGTLSPDTRPWARAH